MGSDLPHATGRVSTSSKELGAELAAITQLVSHRGLLVSYTDHDLVSLLLNWIAFNYDFADWLQILVVFSDHEAGTLVEVAQP